MTKGEIAKHKIILSNFTFCHTNFSFYRVISYMPSIAPKGAYCNDFLLVKEIAICYNLGSYDNK